VLAVVVVAGSELVVTFNLDLLADACEPLGVEALHPDEFLLELHDLTRTARAVLYSKRPTSTRPG